MSSSSSQNSPEPEGLLRILAAAFSGVLFGWLLSKLKTPIQQSTETVHPSAHTDDSRTEAKPPLPLAVTIESYPPPSISEEDKADKKEQRWLNRRTFIATLFTALFAGGLLIVTSKYARYTYRMWGEMQQQTCIQREASINTERAWVGLDSPPKVEVDSLKQKRFTAQITLTAKNFGKGPALNTVADVRFATHGHVLETITASCDLISPFVGLKPNRPVSSSEDISKFQWGQELFTNQPFFNGTNYSGDSADIIGQEVFIVGCIVYKDQFGNPHWTKFSYSTGPYVSDVVRDPSSFKHLYISSANNYTDDVEKKPSCPVTASPK
jgi:hypothetical protein